MPEQPLTVLKTLAFLREVTQRQAERIERRTLPRRTCNECSGWTPNVSEPGMGQCNWRPPAFEIMDVQTADADGNVTTSKQPQVVIATTSADHGCMEWKTVRPSALARLVHWLSAAR